MSVNIPVPQGVKPGLFQFLSEFLRRAIDGSLNPIQINVSINVTSGDLKIVTGGRGVILPNRAGTQYYRVLMENDGTISADPL